MCVRGNTSRGILGPNSNYFGSAAFPIYEWLWMTFRLLSSPTDFKWLNPCVRERWCPQTTQHPIYGSVCVWHSFGFKGRVQMTKTWDAGVYTKEPVLEGSSGWEDPFQGVARLLHRASWAAWRPLSWQVPMPWMDPCYCCYWNLPRSQTYK